VVSGLWLLCTHFRCECSFALSGLEIFPSFCVYRCCGPFAAVALSLQNLFRHTTSFAPDSAGLSKRRSWFLKWSLAGMQLVLYTLWRRPSPLFASIARLPQAINERHLTDQSKGAGSPRPRHQNGDSLGSGTLRYPRERRSRPPGERSPRGKGGHGDRAAIHLGREYGQTDLRGKVSSQSGVGRRQVRLALRLQTQGQGGGQETYPNDKREIAGLQVPQTKVRVCTHWSLPKTVRPS
jgi:hypothetical protein